MGIFAWLFGGGDPTAMAAKLEKRATAVKKEKPDEAIELLRQAEAILKKADFDTSSIRFRIATVLYEAKRFGEAEALLLDEYRTARKWVIGKREFDAANEKYSDRIRLTKLSNGKLQKWEIKRDNNENPDFERNLYCKKIYTKLRTCYEKWKQFEKAIPFAMAEAYAEYENQCHNMFNDDPQPDFKAVSKCLAKIEKPEMMSDLYAVFAKYSKNPDSTKCWQMIDEIQEKFT